MLSPQVRFICTSNFGCSGQARIRTGWGEGRGEGGPIGRLAQGGDGVRSRLLGWIRTPIPRLGSSNPDHSDLQFCRHRSQQPHRTGWG